MFIHYNKSAFTRKKKNFDARFCGEKKNKVDI